MQSRIANYFRLEANGTTFRREVLAGVMFTLLAVARVRAWMVEAI